jgi:cell shape-determining protein MreD
MKFLRGAALGVLLVLAALVQLATPAATAGHAVPDLVPALVFCAAALGGPQLGAWAGLAAGTVLDLAPPAEHPLGQWALVLAVCGAAAGRLWQVGLHPVWNVVGAAAIAPLAHLSFLGVGLALGDLHARSDDTFAALPAAVVWSTGCALALLPVMRRLVRSDSGLPRLP